MTNWYNPKAQLMFAKFEKEKESGLHEHWGNINSFQNDMYKQVNRLEEECLMKVIRTYLACEPDIEDFKKCNRIYRQGVFDSYDFLYEKVMIGTITRVFNENVITV